MIIQCPRCKGDLGDCPLTPQLPVCWLCGFVVNFGETPEGGTSSDIGDAPEYPGYPDSPHRGHFEDSSQYPSTESDCPFRLFVKARSQPSGQREVCFEVRLENCTENEQRGHIWLSSKVSGDGDPEPFVLPGKVSKTLHPVLRTSDSTERIAIRISDCGLPEPFWQGNTLLKREANGTVNIQVDRSVHGETVLFGVEKSPIVVQTPSNGAGEWEPVALVLRCLKELTDIHDVHATASASHDRILEHQQASDCIPVIQSARMTISRRLPGGQESLTQLLCGKAFHFGRARTWRSSQHRDYLPNDIVLRTLQIDEIDDYVSRYHGVISSNGREFLLTNYSGNGTTVAGFAVDDHMQQKTLPSRCLIKPGCNVANNKTHSLGLAGDSTTLQLNARSYRLLSRIHLRKPAFEDCPDVFETAALTLRRTDALRELEEYILFPLAVLFGRSDSCGWQIEDESVESVHGRIIWFDGSFWIEPQTARCNVQVDGKRLEVNQVRRLAPNAGITIGNLQFTILPRWKQHLVDCRCCRSHGDSAK
ncbi:MAG: FHA domain-containing protein [Planctomycetaceae bacterium]|nr:FHA domain-containing protein [Planctomycetaceae bacterium]